jgi:hypothetical protein
MKPKFNNPNYYAARKLMKGQTIISNRIKNGFSVKYWGKLSPKIQAQLAELADRVVVTPLNGVVYYGTVGGETRYHFYDR